MTVYELIAVISFAGLFLGTGYTIGRVVERLFSDQNKKMTAKNSFSV